MDFAIQVSNPSPFGRVEDAESIAEALDATFPLNTEYALLIWNNIYIPLNYKYDVSLILEDVVLLIESIALSEVGKTTVYWPSSTFRAKWEVSWNASSVIVESKWESVIGATESLLNQHPYISVARDQFLSEWGELVRTCLQHLIRMNVDNYLDLSQLEVVLKLVPKRGTLYQY